MNALPTCVDYIISVETPELLRARELQGGSVISKNGKPLRYSGGFCVVFPFKLRTGQKVAVRCWTAHVPDAEKRTRQIATYLHNCNLPYFVGLEYIPQGIATALGVFPIVIMDWVEAKPLKEYIKDNLYCPGKLSLLAYHFLQMTKDLHMAHFSHGDLQHGNIMVNQEDQLYLVDYDSMYVPGLENITDEIKGLAGYQHPGRNGQKYLNPKSDYFSELIIYTSILALSLHPQLWDELKIEDTETMVFSQEDLDSPHKSPIFKMLKDDAQLNHCITAIEVALEERDINKLLPLDEAIIPISTRVTVGLQTKWKPQPVSEIPKKSADIEGLKTKWNNKPQESVTEHFNVSTIASKWKK